MLTRHVWNGSNGDSASPGAGERWRRRTANSWSAWQSRREKPVEPREGGAEGEGEVSRREREERIEADKPRFRMTPQSLGQPWAQPSSHTPLLFPDSRLHIYIDILMIRREELSS